MRRVTKIDLMGVDTDPFGAQAPGEIAADARCHHRDNDKINPGAKLNAVEETPEFDQGESADKLMPAPKATNARVKAEEATPPAQSLPMKRQRPEPLRQKPEPLRQKPERVLKRQRPEPLPDPE